MSYGITEFMWAFQPHFRSAVRYHVGEVFASIGMPVDVKVLLVGVAASARAGHPICVEPEHGDFNSAQLTGLDEDAEQRYRDDPESKIWNSDSRTHELRQNWLRNRSRARAIGERVETSGRFEGFEFFVSTGTPVGSYHVHTCVGLPASTLAAVPQFGEAFVDRFYVGKSFPHVVIDECLRRADSELYKPDAGSDLQLLGDRGELARAAAKRFVDGTCFRLTDVPADLTETLNEVAAQYYERSGAHGRLLLTKRAADRCSTVFTPPVRLSEHRTIRKLLETTSPTLALVADSALVYGLGEPSDADNAVEVSITDHATWDVWHGGRRLVRVSYGKPTIPTTPLPRELVDDVVARIIGPSDRDAIWGIVQSVLQLGHGTTVVVSADPAAEASRLGAKRSPLNPASSETTRWPPSAGSTAPCWLERTAGVTRSA